MTIKINKKHAIVLSFCITLLTLIVSFDGLAQKVKDQNKVVNPANKRVNLSVYDDYVAKQIKLDSDVENLFSSKNNGLDFGGNIERDVLDVTTYDATFRITKDKLTKFLYDPNFAGENGISGLMIEFGTEKTDLNIFRVGELVENVGYKNIDKSFLTLNSTEKAQFNRLSPFTSKNEKDLLKLTNKAGIRGYYIGRNLIFRKLVSESGLVKNDIASLEIEVRVTRDKNKVLLIRAIKTNKSVEFLGTALHDNVFEPMRKTLTKMGGSRPCPTYCRQ
ncbi:hypothetical protein EGI26_07820 [Lacihabitans sp. CCS-44]|uniref:hypothetical protein n=1 Tax=Lacihabitans sp. CCS-44 TaxID=2487331 RepID=UPI0020CC9BED|nr:hypothetical protein [Lacihabitans sp. CCS-44]MCP9755059.1 hypothetical protein [Lacihabitans sp. CCS-44]